MTVQRQYTLPNCNLRVEGLSSGDDSDFAAPLTVVLNAECSFPNLSETLNGGREFLDALVQAVSSYGQSMLSGIAHPGPAAAAASPVVLTPGENASHQLVATLTGDDGETTHRSLSLSTVQLFDLMEAVDQLLADTQTLPDLVLQLSPLHRRHVRPTEPVSKRVVPAVTGAASLAAAAALLFMVPVPEVEPEPSREERNNAAQVEETPSESTAPPLNSPSDASEEAAVAPSGAVADPVTAAAVLSRLQGAPKITDADSLEELQVRLTDTLEAELSAEITFDEALVYRIGVSEAGEILGYKYENDPALDYVDETPLPQLTFIPVEPGVDVEEAIAQFVVRFDPDGNVTVEPFDAEAE